MDYGDEFNAINGQQALEKRTRDFDDFQLELNGGTSKISRSLSGEARKKLTEQKNGKGAGRMTALDLAMLDSPHYAAVYTQSVNRLGELGQLATGKLAEAEGTLATRQEGFSSTQDKAATLPNGRRVYQDANGQAFTEDGTPLGDAQDLPIEWTGAEPTYETFLNQRNGVQAAQDHVNQWSNYLHDVIAPAQNRFADTNNPMTTDEMEEVMKNAEDKLPSYTAPSKSTVESQPQTTAQNFNF